MRKLVASMLFLAAVGSPVTVALAAEDDPPTEARGVSLAAEPAPVPLALAASSERAEERREDRRDRAAQNRTPAALDAIAACESGGDPRAVGGGGAYRGKYQMSRTTWASVGGEGDPAEASEAEQDRRAKKLYERDGAGHWPVCAG